MRSLIPRLFPRFLLRRLLLRRLLLRRLLLLLGFLLFGLFRSRGGFGDSDGREIVPFFSKDSYNLTHWDFLGTRLDDDLAHHAIFLRFHIDRRLVRLLHLSLALNKRDKKEMREKRDGLATSKSTSPAAKLSPSFFFHDAIPPSVMVGDIAGIAMFVVAYRT